MKTNELELTKKVQEVRTLIKNAICEILIEQYKKGNNGILPNWEDEEEIIIDANEFKREMRIGIEVYNTYDENRTIEHQTINEFIVSLDENLFFETEDTYEWTEVSTDELMEIYYKLNKNS